MVKLGDRAKDSITGFQGIVTAKHEYLYGCIRFCITPEELKDGTPIEGQVFDQQQLQVIKNNMASEIKESIQRGGPRDSSPIFRNDPPSR